MDHRIAFFLAVCKKTITLAFSASSLLGGAMKCLAWIIAIGITFGVGWLTFDSRLSVPIGETGYELQIGPIIIGVLCVFAVCFAIAWNTVPKVELLKSECNGEGDQADTYWFVTVKNKGGGSETCRVQIVEAIPRESLATPMSLPCEKPRVSATEELPLVSEARLARDETRKWYLFRRRSTGAAHEFLVPGYPQFHPRRVSTITLRAFVDNGVPSERVQFKIVCDESGGIKLVPAEIAASPAAAAPGCEWVLKNWPSLPQRLYQAWSGFWTTPPSRPTRY